MNTWRLGRIYGIPIELNLSWLIVFALVVVTLATGLFPGDYGGLEPLVYWLMALVAAALFFTSVLLHELGHAVVAMEQGIEIRRITLFVFGGVAQIAGEPNTPGKEFRIAIAGPLTSLLLVLVFHLAAVLAAGLNLGPGVQGVASYLRWINLLLIGFNMVPAFPLDGGRALRAVIWRFTGDVRRATAVASGIGQVFAMLLVGFGILNLLGGGLINGVWFIFIGWFLQQASQAGYAQVLLRQALSGVPVRDLMTAHVRAVPRHLSLARLVEDFFYRHRYTAFPVMDGDDLVGLISINDVKEVPREQWSNTTVGSVAQPVNDEFLVSPGDEAVEALVKMAEKGIGRLLVVEEGRLVGIVTRTDIIRLIKIRQDLNL